MKRDAFFDNAKLLLIFFVVFGHMIQPFIGESNAIHTLYMWVYTFSMPAFIFLAGFFAKGSGNMAYILQLTKKLLFPYLIFQVLYSGYYFMIGKATWQKSLFEPHWSLWFLVSLFSWHILLFLFKEIRPLYSISLAVFIGIMIGYISDIGNVFSLSRTFAFFPFFLVGFWTNKDVLMKIKQNSVKVASVMMMLFVAVVLYMSPDINAGWLLNSRSYVDLGVPAFGGLVRMLVYTVSTMMAIGVLAFVPSSENRLSHLGTRTLYVYLLHGFFIQFFREANLFEVTHPIQLIGLAVISALIVFVLSSKPVLGVWQPFIEGKASILRKRFDNTNQSHT